MLLSQFAVTEMVVVVVMRFALEEVVEVRFVSGLDDRMDSQTERTRSRHAGPWRSRKAGKVSAQAQMMPM